MGATITKNFSLDVIFSRDDGEDLSASDIIYLRLLAQIKKSVAEQVEASMGIHEAHIDGSVVVT